MSEIFTCCDRVSILRDGKFVATNIVSEIDEPTLVEQMIGRRIETPIAKANGTPAQSVEAQALKAEVRGDGIPLTPPQGSPRLCVRDVSSPGKLGGCSLDLHAGEVLGIGGLVGAGRSELFDAIFNIDTRAKGSVKVDGQEILGKGIRAAIDAGVGLGYVPEDRRIQGLFFNLGIDENIIAPIMNRFAKLGVRNRSSEIQAVKDRIGRFQIKTASLSETTPGELSGGNQQKLLIARWMTDQTKVLLLDEPTRGIDVGTKAEIYKLIRQAASEGLAILLVSSEMPELLALSDRILVMGEGQIKGKLTGEDMTQTNILTLATKETDHSAVC